ncbi:MAG: hypothetical protein J0M08_03215 [Bacteroidetes bacterium]|nr:hypothetical protein [Bacteroidota bacterium]
MNKYLVLIVLVLCLAIAFNSCKKDPEFDNPYDDPALQDPGPSPGLNNPAGNNFAYLYEKIFRPTCGNVQCHDGTFMPDFRSIYSSYNTLLYAPTFNHGFDSTIMQPLPQVYRYRVLPGNSDSSMLYVRLTQALLGTQGRMPFLLSNNPNSTDWTNNADTYIQNIKDWINAGAKDMFNNSPTLGNKQPQTVGFMAFPVGNTSSAYPRFDNPNKRGSILVPQGSVDLWFAVEDDSTSAAAISNNTIKFANSVFKLDTTAAQNLTVVTSPISGPKLLDVNTSVSYTRKITINTATYSSGTVLYVRLYLDDNDQPVVTETPNIGVAKNVFEYFTLKIQ